MPKNINSLIIIFTLIITVINLIDIKVRCLIDLIYVIKNDIIIIE